MRSVRGFTGFVKKDFLLLYKRKKYLYLFILLPLVIASLFLFALNPSSYDLRVGVCDFDRSSLSLQSYARLEGFSPTLLPADDSCLLVMSDLIKRGKLDLGLEVGSGFSDNILNLKQAKLVVYYDSTDVAFSNLISWKVDQSLEPFKREIISSLNDRLSSHASSARSSVNLLLEVGSLPSSLDKRVKSVDSELQKVEELNTEFLVNPVWSDKRSVYDEELKKESGIVFIFPIIVLFIVLLLSSTSVIYDKNNGFLTRVKSSSSVSLYLFSKLVFFVLLALVQFLIILGLFFSYGAHYPFSPVQMFLLVLFVGVVDALLGLLIGLFANNEGIAVLFSLMVSFPLMLVSGVFFPLQILPRVIQGLARVLPLHYQISASKAVLLFGQELSYMWVFFAVGLFFVVWFLLRKS